MHKLNNTDQSVFSQRHPRKPIIYWTANIKTNWITDAVNEIDRHESIAILKARYGSRGIIYRAVR